MTLSREQLEVIVANHTAQPTRIKIDVAQTYIRYHIDASYTERTYKEFTTENHFRFYAHLHPEWNNKTIEELEKEESAKEFCKALRIYVKQRITLPKQKKFLNTFFQNLTNEHDTPKIEIPKEIALHTQSESIKKYVENRLEPWIAEYQSNIHRWHRLHKGNIKEFEEFMTRFYNSANIQYEKEIIKEFSKLRNKIRQEYIQSLKSTTKPTVLGLKKVG